MSKYPWSRRFRVSQSITYVQSMFTLSFVVVQQFYQSRVSDEFVLRGNTAILKCQIPSFVADFIEVVAWVSDEGDTFLKDSSYLQKGRKGFIWQNTRQCDIAVCGLSELVWLYFVVFDFSFGTRSPSKLCLVKWIVDCFLPRFLMATFVRLIIPSHRESTNNETSSNESGIRHL